MKMADVGKMKFDLSEQFKKENKDWFQKRAVLEYLYMVQIILNAEEEVSMHMRKEAVELNELLAEMFLQVPLIKISLTKSSVSCLLPTR